jgi:hypothetical protein
MPFTQQQLDTLDNAIAQGVLVVEYSDKKVTYRSLSEMLKTRGMMIEEISGKSRSKAMYPRFDKGL